MRAVCLASSPPESGAALPPVQPGLVFTIRVTNTDGNVDATRAFDLVPVTDGYFEALGARILEGRTLTAARQPLDGRRSAC